MNYSYKKINNIKNQIHIIIIIQIIINKKNNIQDKDFDLTHFIF